MQPLTGKNLRLLPLGLSAAVSTSCAIDGAPPDSHNETSAVTTVRASACTRQRESHSDSNTGQSWTAV